MRCGGNFDRWFFWGASLLVLSASLPVAALAQPGRVVLEELVVTAEKREASIQDVPMAVSAFTEERLENMQVNDGQDLALVVPNMQFSKQNFTTTNIAIRGIGHKLNAVSGDTAVGFHINGAPLWASRIFETEFFDVERVEVLRGPQGTLYGRNASAGVINVITAKPKLGTWTGGLEGTIGNYDAAKVRGHVNVPVGQSLALRLAGFATRRDGFTRNVTTGSRLDGRDMYSLRATLAWEITERDRISVMGQVFDEDSNRSRIGKQLCAQDRRPWPYSQGCLPTRLTPGSPTSYASSGGLFAFQPSLLSGLNDNLSLYPVGSFTNAASPPGLREQAPAVEPSHKAHEAYFQFEYSHDFGWGAFTALTSYQRDRVSSDVDFTQTTSTIPFAATPLAPGGVLTYPYLGSNTSPRAFDRSAQKTEQITQELRLVSSLDGPLNFTVGGIYIDMEVRNTLQTFSNLIAYGALLNSVPITSGFVGSENNPYRLEAAAIFGELYYAATDSVDFTLGLRYTNDQKYLRNRNTFVTATTFDPPFRERSAAFEEVTGRVGVEWKTALPLADESNVYVFLSRGYKGGGLNPGDTSSFDPEFVNAIELGVKNTFADGRLRANLTAFHYDYQGYQVSRIVNRSAINENIDAKVKGFEAEFAWTPTRQLALNLNIAWLDAEVGKGVTSVNTIDPTGGDPNYAVVKIFNTGSNCIVDSAALAALVQLAGRNPSSVAIPATQASLLPGATAQPLLQFSPSATNPTPLTAAQLAGAAACQVLTPAPSAGQAALVAAVQGMVGRAILPASGSSGIPTGIGGNRLPNAPEWQLGFGAQYTLELPSEWSMTVRGDYGWQAKSYSRIFNGPSDRLAAYDQINASVRFENARSGLYVAAFVKNLEDADVITDLFLSDQSSGLFSNAFLLEPRTFGVTVGAKW